MTKTLIVHIGTGKTGSTAIQRYLFKRIGDFALDGVHYWGLNLEHAATKTRYAWQSPVGIGHLQQLPEKQAEEELATILEEGFSKLEPGEIAIWSNESIYERPSLYIPLLQAFQAKPERQVFLYAYARDMREYIVSAYKQWGVKHKTYSGHIRGFKDWVKSHRDFLSYGIKLIEWEKAFTEAFILINYNQTSNVVADFLARLPVSKTLLPPASAKRANPTPSDIHLAIYALYNNQFTGPVLPLAISTLLSRYNLEQGDYYIRSLSSIYPSVEELDEAESMFSDDIHIVNTMLSRHGQQPLVSSQDSVQLEALSEQEVTQSALSLLITILVEQDRRINSLERLVTDIVSDSHPIKS